MVIIYFAAKTDYLRVLKGCLWLFDRYLFTLQKVNPRSIPSSFQPSPCPFWVQIHDLPIGLLNISFSRIAVNEIGKFVEADTDKDGSIFGRFIRIKVDLNLSKPLKRCIVITQRGIDKGYLVFYERLPLFCFFYRRLNHLEKGSVTRSISMVFKLLQHSLMATIFARQRMQTLSSSLTLKPLNPLTII